MKRMMLVAAFAAAPLCAQEKEAPSRQSWREALHAEILACLPPLPAAAARPDEQDAGDEVIVLEPLIVTEARREGAVARLIARAEQRQAAERFTALKGGTLFRRGRIVVGLWPDGANLAVLKLSW